MSGSNRSTSFTRKNWLKRQDMRISLAWQSYHQEFRNFWLELKPTSLEPTRQLEIFNLTYPTNGLLYQQRRTLVKLFTRVKIPRWQTLKSLSKYCLLPPWHVCKTNSQSPGDLAKTPGEALAALHCVTHRNCREFAECCSVAAGWCWPDRWNCTPYTRLGLCDCD